MAVLRAARLVVQRKTGHADEQARDDLAEARRAWFATQPDLDPEPLIFIDETWLNTKMARLRGRSPRGERLRASPPHGHWRRTTFVAGLRFSGVDASMVLDGPINGEIFTAYVEQVLAPTLRPGDIVIMDNLGGHKGEGVRSPDQRRRGRAALPPALQSRLQSDRERLLEAQGDPAQGRRTLP